MHLRDNLNNGIYSSLLAKINETDTFEGGEDDIPFDFADTLTPGAGAGSDSEEYAEEIGMLYF